MVRFRLGGVSVVLESGQGAPAWCGSLEFRSQWMKELQEALRDMEAYELEPLTAWKLQWSTAVLRYYQ